MKRGRTTLSGANYVAAPMQIGFVSLLVSMIGPAPAAAGSAFQSGPVVTERGRQFALRFALESPNDVAVEVHDSGGRVVRHLGAGRLGKEAPAPFKSNSLAQEIVWDGRDNAGKPSPAGQYTVTIKVGLGAVFDRIHLWNPKALGYVWGMAVDEQGRLYVLNRLRGFSPPEIQVFERNGEYVKTIMPFNPAIGWKRVEKLPFGLIETAPGFKAPKMVPRMPWETNRSFLIYETKAAIPESLFMLPGGDLVLMTQGSRVLMRLAQDGGIAADRFFSHPQAGKYASFLPFGEAGQYSHHYFAADGDGTVYISTGRQSGRQGTVWAFKLDGVEATPVKQFQYAGSAKLDAARAFLGAGKEPGAGEVQFNGPCGVAVDAAGNLYVADSGNHKLHVFRKDGKLLTSVSQVTLGGKQAPLESPTALALDKHAGHLYVATSGKQGVEILKLKDYQQPIALAQSGRLDGETLDLVLDPAARPPLLWVSNAAGAGTVVQFETVRLTETRKIAPGAEPGLVVPLQCGNMPILSADPETGEIYVCDARQSHGEGGGSPGRWWRMQPDGTAAPMAHEDPRAGCIFGKDGLLYKWHQRITGKSGPHRLYEIEILRFDRDGKPVPFKATGTNAIRTYEGQYHYSRPAPAKGLFVTRNGDIYAIITISNPRQSPHLNVYDKDGRLKKEALIRLANPFGVVVDGVGHIYIGDHDSGAARESGNLYKFTAQGGSTRNAPGAEGGPLWKVGGVAWRGGASSPHCVCAHTFFHSADDHGRMYVPDNGNYCVRVIDTAGNVLARIGNYGNMDCRGPASAYPQPPIAFYVPGGTVVVGDLLYVVDTGNRRLLRCKLTYQEEKRAMLSVR